MEGGRLNAPSRCSYGVPTMKLSKVQDAYAFISEVLIKSTKKVEYLEREKLNIKKKSKEDVLPYACFENNSSKGVKDPCYFGE
jgi:hypothetical protein